MPTRLYIPQDITTQRGNALCVPLRISNLSADPDNNIAGGLLAADIQIHFDASQLWFDTVEAGDYLNAADWTIQVNSSIPGRLMVNLIANNAGMPTPYDDDTELLKLYFYAPRRALGQTLVQIITDDQQGGTATHVVDGQFNDYVLTPPPGDAGNDGVVVITE
jgi:hypothetical protein